jgi:hypothetical protein
MREFSTAFDAEKNRRADGPAPINLLTFGFATPVYLSDRDITPANGSAHLGLVKTWGFIDSSISQTPGSGILGTIEIADLQLTIINSTTPRFSDNFTVSNPPENVTVSLYQWFAPLQDSQKELIFQGVIYGQPEWDEYVCTITVRGILQKYNCKIGEDKIIYADGYPDADPDEYGKMGNIIYGDLKDVPCHAIVSGDVNSLIDDITESQTSIELSDASYFPPSGIIGIDAEKISYTGNSGNVLTGCTRGYNSTTAVTHLAGSAVWEELTLFVYQIACHPVNLIGDIFCDGVRITSMCTKYTGQSGNELTGWEGKAVFTVPSKLTRQQAIDLLINDGITIHDAIAVVDTIAVIDGISISDAIAVSDTIGVSTGSHYHTAGLVIYSWQFDSVVAYSGSVVYGELLIDQNLQTQGDLYSTNGAAKVTKSIYAAPGGIPYQFRVCLRTGSDINGKTITAEFRDTTGYDDANAVVACNTINTTVKSDWTTCGSHSNTWELFNNLYGIVSHNDTGGTNAHHYVCEVWVEVSFYPNTNNSAATGVAKTGSASKSGTVSRSGAVTKSGAASKSGTVTREGEVTLSGNSVADVRVGQLITAHVQGYRDDISGTYTGTPNALIERPDHIFKHIWSILMGAPFNDIDTTSFDASGAFYAANTYKFAKLINEPVQAVDLLTSLALQCRSRFIVSSEGKAKLLVRQLNQSSSHSVVKNEIKYDSMSVKRSLTDEIINLFYINCDLDLTLSPNDPISYKYNLKFTDATSITRYGQRTWQGASDIFCFDAVRDTAMCVNVGNFLLAYHCRARNMPHFGVFLDNLEIEPGDIIDITHPLDAMTNFVAEVLKVVHHLGNATQIDWLEITGIENTT